MTPEDLAAIRTMLEDVESPPDSWSGYCRALLAHIDAITEAVEGLDTGTGPVDYGDGDVVYALGSVPKYRAAVLALLRGES